MARVPVEWFRKEWNSVLMVDFGTSRWTSSPSMCTSGLSGQATSGQTNLDVGHKAKIE